MLKINILNKNNIKPKKGMDKSSNSLLNKTIKEKIKRYPINLGENEKLIFKILKRGEKFNLEELFYEIKCKYDNKYVK